MATTHLTTTLSSVVPICSLCKEDIGDESHFLTSCEALKDEQFDLKQLLNNEDDNFELNDVMRRLHEKAIAMIVMNILIVVVCALLGVLYYSKIIIILVVNKVQNLAVKYLDVIQY